MKILNPLKCILLWLILVIAMILHFNYHIGEIFYGIDVAREGANGVVPISTHVIRNIFYHLPIIWIVVLMLTNATIVRAGLFFISIVYAFAHLMHLIRDAATPSLSQTPLLTIALLLAVLLCVEHFKYWRRPSTS